MNETRSTWLLRDVASMGNGDILTVRDVSIRKDYDSWWIQAGGATQFTSKAKYAVAKARKLQRSMVDSVESIVISMPKDGDNVALVNSPNSGDSSLIHPITRRMIARFHSEQDGSLDDAVAAYRAASYRAEAAARAWAIAKGLNIVSA